MATLWGGGDQLLIALGSPGEDSSTRLDSVGIERCVAASIPSEMTGSEGAAARPVFPPVSPPLGGRDAPHVSR